jgi:hypothetical protein
MGTVLNWSRWVKRPFNQWVFGTTFSGVAGGCSIFASNSLMDKRYTISLRIPVKASTDSAA